MNRLRVSNSITDGNGHKPREDLMDTVIVGQTKPSPQLTSVPEFNHHPQLDHKSRGRVAVFIDASNLFYAAQHLDITVDYGKLLCQLVDGSRLLRAFFYTGVDSTNSKQQGFLLWLRRHGYRVIAKELVPLPDGTKKANVDVEMAVDMLDLAPHYDTAILVSGNGALTYAVNAVSYLGVRIEIVSLRSMTSDLLLSVADVHIDLQQIKDQIRK